MPLASSLSSAQKRAETVERERREQRRRDKILHGARRTSLPSTAPSSTVATKEKVDRRRSLRRDSLSSKPPLAGTAKENSNTNADHYQPPETRSAKKKRLNSSFLQNNSTTATTGMALTFSPPNQAENERREKERIEREEAERASRVEQARLNGQLLVFSPSNRPARTSSSRHGSSDSVANSDDTSHLTESVGDDEKANRQEEMLQKLQDDMSLLVESQNRERRLSDADLLKLVESKTEAAASQSSQQLEETNSKLLQDLKDVNHTLATSKEQFAAEKTRLEMQLQHSQGNVTQLEQLRDTLQQQTASLESEKSQLITTVRTLEQDLVDAKELLEEHQTSRQNLQQEYELEKEALVLGKDQLAAAKKGLEAQLDDVTQSNQQLERTIAEYSATIEQYKYVTVHELEVQVQSKLDTIAQLETNLDTSSAALKECQATIETLKNDIDELKAKNEEERQSFQLLNENSHSAFEKMTSEAADKDAQIAKLTQQLQELGDTLETERNNMKASNETLQQANEKLKAERKQLNDALEETMVQLDQSEQDKKALRAKLDKALAQVEKSKTAIDAKDSEAAELIDGFVQQIADERQLREAAEQRAVNVEQRHEEVQQRARQYEQQTKEMEQRLKETLGERDMARNNMQGFNEREEELYLKLRESDRIRREMHARIMQLMGNIRVFVRVRPALPGELEHQQQRAAAATSVDDKKRKRDSDATHKDDGTGETLFRFPGVYDRSDKKQNSGATAATAEDLTKNLIEVQEPYKDRGGLKDRRKKWRFGFDNVFSPSHGQSEVWEATEPLIQSAVDGFNVTVFAYGQTGSGKTYTMVGEDGNDGLIGRSVQKMFEEKREIEDLSRGETTVSMSVELLEVYNEKVRDLLSKDKDQDLKVTSNEVVGNIVVETATQDSVMEVLGFAQSNRCVKATNSNAVSSRSHMIFTLHFNVTAKNGVTRSGKLNICDLAGSERLTKSGAHIVGGALLEESKNINKSLSTLSNVIERLQAGDKNIPFRESKLTYLLKNSLSGNSKTLAIVCCNPLAAHVQESLCSLRFAEKVNRVDLKAVANFSC